MARDVTLRATYQDLVGDETYELWLKHESDAWALEDTGDVVPDMSDQQEFLILALEEGDDYVAQMRLKRAGRYAAGYLTGNPDTWPSQSRCEFTPGALEGVGAPSIANGVWERTSSTETNIQFEITADDLTKDILLYDAGILIDTIAAPHTNPIAYQHDDPTIAITHSYTARHTDGGLNGPLSAAHQVFAGPPVVEDFVQLSADDNFGGYEVGWDAGGDTVRLQDDFLCVGVHTLQFTGIDTDFERLIEMDVIPDPPDHPLQRATITARIRREVTSFTVLDVSDWVSLLVECDIYDDNADYHSCP